MPQKNEKDPSAVLDYPINWSGWLATGETIVTSTWTVTDGITKDSDTKTNTTTTIWLSGGTVGNTYYCTNHIVTSDGREESRTKEIVVVSK